MIGYRFLIVKIIMKSSYTLTDHFFPHSTSQFFKTFFFKTSFLNSKKATSICVMDKIKHKILVLSGKGGVGKSMVASQLALSLVKEGFSVGLLDIDLCGPSIPKVLGLNKASAYSGASGWVPVFADPDQKLAVMSIGFLLEDEESAVIWRGPKKSAIIKQFIEDVAWGERDFLIVDTPPGTSDEHITVCELLSNHSPDGAIIVTTPQNVSTSDVRKEISFCKTIGLPILGLIENMSGFVCPHCEECTNIFSKGGGEIVARDTEIPFLGTIPIDPLIARTLDEGKSILSENADSKALDVLRHFAKMYKTGV